MPGAVPDALPPPRARATRMRRDAAWAAWRAAFQKRHRDDAIRAYQAARAAAELLRLLAAKPLRPAVVVVGRLHFF